MPHSHYLGLCGLFSLLLARHATYAAVPVTGPADEMQKFIDECNYMIDEMNHCAQGWVSLEEEIITSVETFSGNIIFTETLILEETGLILDMADRIVQTENIMIDLVESCDCSSSVGISHTHEYKSAPKRGVKFSSSTPTPISGGEKKIVVENISKTTVVTLSNHTTGVTIDKCSVMDDIIEVMDACIDAFVVYNDDFIAVLSYMDQAILDMGERIVNTECLIVNMSYQIGDMADLVVETEELMADMASSCCRDGEDKQSTSTFGGNTISSKSMALAAQRTAEDDLMQDCTFDVTKRKIVTFDSSHVLGMSKTAREQLHRKLQLLPSVVQDIERVSYLRKTLLPTLAITSPPQDVMPCDTWWDPFCCAAEVCADIMVEMIEMMADGADWMEEICEDCIDLIGSLADDIVKTEENIILMGYAINDMAEYMVVFIDEGLEFMALFCPNSQKTYSLRGHFKLKQKVSLTALNRSPDGVKFKDFVAHMATEYLNQTVAKQLLHKVRNGFTNNVT